MNLSAIPSDAAAAGERASPRRAGRVLRRIVASSSFAATLVALASGPSCSLPDPPPPRIALADADWTLLGDAAELAGWQVTDGGDLDGDGNSDVVVADAGAGRVGVFFGRLAPGTVVGPDDADVTVDTGLAGIHIAVASPGNVTPDGADDLVIGIPELSAGAGGVLVFEGPLAAQGPSDPPLTSADAFAVLAGESPGDLAGHALAAGSFRGTVGVLDLAVGAPGFAGAKGAGSGAVYWLHGPLAAGPASLGDAATRFTAPRGTLPSPLPGLGAEMLGFSLASGDFDGDGADDLAMGAPGYDKIGLPLPQEAGTPQAFALNGGAAVVFYGARQVPGEVDLTTAGWRISGRKPRQMVGYSLAAGDSDGDGLDDLLIGAPYDPEIDADDTVFDPQNPTVPGWEGRAYLVYGIRSTTPALDHFPPAGDYVLDLLEGPTLAGGPGGTLPDMVLRGEADFDRLGIAVTMTDLSGDRRADSIVGSRVDEVYVDYGSDVAWRIGYRQATGDPSVELPANQARLVLDGPPGELAGASLAGLGDQNSDRVEELIVGAPGATDPGLSSAGRAYVLFGHRRFLPFEAGSSDDG